MAAAAAGLTFQFKTLMREQPATVTLGTPGEGRLAALEKKAPKAYELMSEQNASRAFVYEKVVLETKWIQEEWGVGERGSEGTGKWILEILDEVEKRHSDGHDFLFYHEK